MRITPVLGEQRSLKVRPIVVTDRCNGNHRLELCRMKIGISEYDLLWGTVSVYASNVVRLNSYNEQHFNINLVAYDVHELNNKSHPTSDVPVVLSSVYVP